MPYHHGNVRSKVLTAAVEAITERGATGVSFRDLARRVGVTHGAVSHHFGDKTGLFTALAAGGFDLLRGELELAWSTSGRFEKVGIAYVRFATRWPAHFEVMFRPELHHVDDPALVEAKAGAGRVLFESAQQVLDAADGDQLRAGIAAWAYVHGIAILWRDGNLPPPWERDPVGLAMDIVPFLFQASAQTPPPHDKG
ncbi:MAG TPA: TetR/AcrR family transcriptional regulator [Acidimicrobiales bacterium]|nr:TetR/AcrR family transcriptional regulator [Acidimicrobiales bacterium]